MIDREIAIVTGTSKGIGKAIALKLADENKIVCAFARTQNKIDELVRLNKNIIPFIGDITNKSFVENSVNKILNDFGKVDHLINNAGMAVFKKFVDSNIEDLQKQIDINLYAVFNLTKALVNHFIERRSGTIINISSLAGKNGFAYGTTYASTKHALMGFTKSLFMELREYDIRVSAVCPGSVETEMIIDSPVRPQKIDKALKPDDVAEVVSTIIKMPANALISEIELRPNNVK